MYHSMPGIDGVVPPEYEEMIARCHHNFAEAYRGNAYNGSIVALAMARSDVQSLLNIWRNQGALNHGHCVERPDGKIEVTMQQFGNRAWAFVLDVPTGVSTDPEDYDDEDDDDEDDEDGDD